MKVLNYIDNQRTATTIVVRFKRVVVVSQPRASKGTGQDNPFRVSLHALENSGLFYSGYVFASGKSWRVAQTFFVRLEKTIRMKDVIESERGCGR